MIDAPRPDVLFLLTVVTAGLLALALLLAALTLLLRARNALKARRWARVEGTWAPLMFDVLAGDLAPQALLARVQPAERLLFADFLMRFARRLKGDELETLRGLAAPLLDGVAARARGGPAERRARALQTVGDLGSVAQLGEVVEALDDPSPLVAMTAARALSRRRLPEHVGPVVARLARFGDWSHAFLAATLAAFGPPAAAALRRSLEDAAQPPAARIVAAEALRLLHDLVAAGQAARVAAASTDADLVCACLRLLAAVGTAEQAPAVRAATSSSHPAIRAQAVAALASLGGPEDRDRLLAALDDRSPWVVLRAAESLKALAGPAPVLAATSRPGDSVAALALAE